MKYRSLILRSLCACMFLFGAGHTLAQDAPQEQMEALARRLDLGAKRADSQRPQPTTSGVSGARGFYQCFTRGCVYYSKQTGLHAVTGSIFDEYVRAGTERGSLLGFPTEGVRQCPYNPNGPWESESRYQVFEGRVLQSHQGSWYVNYWPLPLPPQVARTCPVMLTAAPPRESKISLPSKSGRFRVTLNGFTVNHDTYDHALGYDGQGDEVYIIVDAVDFNGAGAILSRRNLQTPIMGEANGQGDRIQAGRATDRGGLRTGNQFPTNEPWRRAGALMERQPPMLLWEGTLTNDGMREGTTAALIVPTIWERDELPQFVETYRSNLDTRLAGYVRTLNASDLSLGNLIGGASPLGDYEVGTGINLASHDRPPSVWPKRLLLTYDIAQQAASSTRDGLGTGIFRVRYQDSEDLGGDYTLYIQVERIP
jgi:hypothetical protein